MFLLLLQSVALSYFDYLEASVTDVEIFLSAIQFAFSYLQYSAASQCFSLSLALSFSLFVCSVPFVSVLLFSDPGIAIAIFVVVIIVVVVVVVLLLLPCCYCLVVA